MREPTYLRHPTYGREASITVTPNVPTRAKSTTALQAFRREPIFQRQPNLKREVKKGNPPMPRRKKYELPPDAAQTPRTTEQGRLALTRKVRMFYDLQEMRMGTEGRLTPKADAAKIELHPLDMMRLTDRLTELATAEKNALKDIEDHLLTIPFYVSRILPERATKWRGFGPTMMGVILSSFDIAREDTVSKMWAYAGLRPMPAFRCKTCNVVCTSTLERMEGDTNREGDFFKHPKPAGVKCIFLGLPIHNDQVYESAKAQRPVAGEKLPYNAWLRTKLCGVLGGVLMKLDSPFRKFYDDYKARKQAAGWGINDGHRHNAAIRYMVKMVLLELHKEWRTFEGLPLRPSYQEEYLGHTHHAAPVAMDVSP
jgi:hypothetical protein